MKQIAITIGEMKRLQELGVDCSKASMCWEYLPTAEAIMNGTFDDVDGPYLLANTGFKHDFPAFTLQEILDLLPKEIRYNGIRYYISICASDEFWIIEYKDVGGYSNKSFCSNDLLDVAYKTLVWCLEKDMHI